MLNAQHCSGKGLGIGPLHDAASPPEWRKPGGDNLHIAPASSVKARIERVEEGPIEVRAHKSTALKILRRQVGRNVGLIPTLEVLNLWKQPVVRVVAIISVVPSRQSLGQIAKSIIFRRKFNDGSEEGSHIIIQFDSITNVPQRC